MQDVIEVKNLTKIFRLPHDRSTTLKQTLINFGRRTYEELKALDNISFHIRKGEFFGVVGRNGSGKSTLLKLLADIYSPTSGNITVRGRLTPFIELGIGFNPELTGRENVFLNGAILGLTEKEVAAKYEEIVTFAELEKFMDQKLKNYSSGMQVRLAFSIAIQAQNEILLIDEVLAVGDSAFQQKCYDYFDKIKRSDRTVIFISHDMGAIQTFCDRAILINNGQLIIEGKPVEVTQEYARVVSKTAQKTRFESSKLQHIGVGGAEILKGEIFNSRGKVTTRLKEGEPFAVRLYFKTSKSIKESVVGVGIMGEKGQSIIGPNTRESSYELKTLPKRGYVEAKFPTNPLSPGTYRLRGGIFNMSNTIPYDFVEQLASFTVIGKKRYGDVYVEPEWSVG